MKKVLIVSLFLVSAPCFASLPSSLSVPVAQDEAATKELGRFQYDLTSTISPSERLKLLGSYVERLDRMEMQVASSSDCMTSVMADAKADFCAGVHGGNGQGGTGGGE